MKKGERKRVPYCGIAHQHSDGLWYFREGGHHGSKKAPCIGPAFTREYANETARRIDRKNGAG